MIAHRYVPVLCVLALCALVPTWIHSYSGAVAVDGRKTARISPVLGAYRGTSTNRKENWGMRRFDSADWFERTYADGRHEVRLTVVRSYDPKSLYHHPELAIAYPASFGRPRVERLPGREDVPVFVLRPAPGAELIAAYVLHYDDRFVDAPILFQLRTAGELLFTRRKPMTLFFATESSPSPDASLEELGAATVLASAVDAFVAQAPDGAAVAGLE